MDTLPFPTPIEFPRQRSRVAHLGWDAFGKIAGLGVQPTNQRQIIGVDVGQRYLATVATTTNDAQFYSGKEIRSKAEPGDFAPR